MHHKCPDSILAPCTSMKHGVHRKRIRGLGMLQLTYLWQDLTVAIPQKAVFAQWGTNHIVLTRKG